MNTNLSPVAYGSLWVLLLLLPGVVIGQTPGDVCRVALESDAFNTLDQTVSNRIAFEKKENLCQRDYSSTEEFRNAARSGGFNLSFKGVGLGATEGQSSGTGRVHFRNEAFCQASQQDFFQEYQATTSVRIGDVALRAWSDCISNTNENSLWLHYTVQPDGTGMTGTLRRTIRTGTTNLKITSMQVHPDHLADEVRCTVAGHTFTPTLLAEKGPIETPTTSEIVSCTKPETQTVRVALATDGGSLTWITMPSAEEKRQTDLDLLQASLESMAARMSRMESSINGLASGVQRNAQGIESESRKANQRIDQYYNRIWENVSQERVLGRDYVNDRPYPIDISVWASSHGVVGGNKQNRCDARLHVNDRVISHARRNLDMFGYHCVIYGKVPPGQTYRIETHAHEVPKNRAAFTWYELR